jgi:hypothetical protein
MDGWMEEMDGWIGWMDGWNEMGRVDGMGGRLLWAEAKERNRQTAKTRWLYSRILVKLA